MRNFKHYAIVHGQTKRVPGFPNPCHDEVGLAQLEDIRLLVSDFYVVLNIKIIMIMVGFGARFREIHERLHREFHFLKRVQHVDVLGDATARYGSMVSLPDGEVLPPDQVTRVAESDSFEPWVLLQELDQLEEGNKLICTGTPFMRRLVTSSIDEDFREVEIQTNAVYELDLEKERVKPFTYDSNIRPLS